MTKQTVAQGVVHDVPADLEEALIAAPAALEKWNDLTPLAWNEWICWVTFVKKDKTRKAHVTRLIDELTEGIRRPCCWIGCTHRTDKQISPSQKFILGTRFRHAAR